MRNATWSTARSSVTLMCSPRNIASMRSLKPARFGQREQQLHRLGADAVLRVVEEQVTGLGREPLTAAGVVREQVAEMHVLHLSRSGLRPPSTPASRRLVPLLHAFFSDDLLDVAAELLAHGGLQLVGEVGVAL